MEEAIELTGKPIASTTPNKCCTFGYAMNLELEIAYMPGLTGNPDQSVPLAALSKPSVKVKFAFGSFSLYKDWQSRVKRFSKYSCR